ncbi:MAG: hypothetical protein CMJ18_15535 [Phycisphaeraceae bacterium]|nr:hypothetical protein [Phycisphaeraceae bacterium]
MLKSLSIRVLTLILVCSFAIPAFSQTRMTWTQKQKIKKAVRMARAVLGACVDLKLEDWLNQAGPDVEYERKSDGSKVTVGDALNEIVRKLDRNEITLDPNTGFGGSTRPEGGLRDKVTAGEGMMDLMCGPNGWKKMGAKVLMMDVLVNEIIHVYQKNANTYTKMCDSERDSDRMSLEFLRKFRDALIDPATNAPYTTVGGMPDTDLRKCLQESGVANADVATLHGWVSWWRTKLVNQSTALFENRLATFPSTQTWLDYYDDGWVDRAWPHGATNVTTNQEGVILTDFLGLSSTTFWLPANHQVVQIIGMRDKDGNAMLVVVTRDQAGRLHVNAWTDTDGDELPETATGTGAIPANFNPPVADPFQISAQAQMNVVPSTGVSLPYLLVHDQDAGSLFGWIVDPLNPGVGLQTIIPNDPGLTNTGGFVYLTQWIDVGPGVGRAIFTNVPDTFVTGSDAALWFDIDVLGGLVVGQGLSTLAEALVPFNQIGIAGFQHGAPGPVQLLGNPGDSLYIGSIGHGVLQVLNGAVVGPNGQTSALTLAGLTDRDDLFIVTNGAFGEEYIFFSPRVGQGLDCAGNDEDGDGAIDRIDLTEDPSRLHYSAGDPTQPAGDPVMNHLFELVLEQPDGFMIDSWSSTSRKIVMSSGSRDFTLLPNSTPPLYVQSIEDLNGDGTIDDSVTVVRFDGTPAFELRVYTGVQTQGNLIQGLLLPDCFEPSRYEFQDADGDLDLDVVIYDLNDVPAIAAINDGAANFTLTGGCFTLSTTGAFDLTISATPSWKTPNAVRGYTLFSFDASPGPIFGMTPDALTWSIIGMPAIPGSFLPYPVVAGLYPDVPWQYPAGTFVSLAGTTASGIQIMVDGVGAIDSVSNVSRVTF